MRRAQVTVVIVVAFVAWLGAQAEQAKRIRHSTTVLDEIMAAPDQAMTQTVPGHASR